MKILVCIANVPDTTAKINFTPDNKEFVSTGVTFILNPYDEIALSKAVDLTTGGGTVTVINIGDASTEPTIRKALAIGATDAVRVNSKPRDGYFVARQIAEYVKTNPFDLILCGRESSDSNGSSVPAMLAELLGIPCVLFAKRLTIEGTNATLEQEIEGGKEILSSPLPLVAGASEGMAEWKIPNMRGIMSARTKPLVVIEPIEVPQHTTVKSYDKPIPRSSVKLIAAEDAGKLFDMLRDEKKVI
ncbi:MAG: electron transfer flavoprotein subunit beta/FixA family protein [Bacteroidetes bacterium]|nr:electron transfer flavoprotein subunit beta/FixA family protein [Bacteroidota bacterium]MBP6403311.1 electron transfer flavoprotein subunit beta/FixA family protein [Bacteroidia bacterium]MBK6837210.1 electron transfer flavoprotein subunit beta/FixA family protein [Bacteroidota bacterium]MBK9523391.1 electron transfer flavoprotein subunit beta/FixA family protein [Bacteroidota bacterium]MBK9541134.1 electron transfer flavoprotein subunit beta/FixA family protein [Bacteroidota bacterium]